MGYRLIKLPEVTGTFAEGVTQIYARIKNGTCTLPIKLTPRTSAWPEHEIQSIIAARISGKSDDEIRDLVSSLVAARSDAAPAMRAPVAAQPSPVRASREGAAGRRTAPGNLTRKAQSRVRA